MSTRVVKLTIINDLVCPFCCISQYELLDAIALSKDRLQLPISFELEYLPFRLISTACLTEDTPKIDKATFYKDKLGMEKFTNVENSVTKWAEEKNIPISFRGVMSQSTRAHRLSQKAYRMGGQTLQHPLLCAIFKAYLEEEKDIADMNVLAEVAEGVGMMSRDQALRFLESNELETEVIKMCDDARLNGITGVPVTVIDGKWAVSGSQSSEVFLQIFQKLADGVHISPPPFAASVLETDCSA